MERIIKPLLLLMIGMLTCVFPMLGYYTIAESWYTALCGVKGMPIVAVPFMIYTILANGGMVMAMKYGTIFATTGICVCRYKRLSNNYSPYVTAFIATVVTVGIETIDWYMNGMIKSDIYVLAPMIMLTWSMTVIFSYGVNFIMEFIPK